MFFLSSNRSKVFGKIEDHPKLHSQEYAPCTLLAKVTSILMTFVLFKETFMAKN